MTHPHVVALVLDSNFGDLVDSIASRVHVWLACSEANQAAANAWWAASPSGNHSIENGITIFAVDPNDRPEQSCADILGTIDLHHGEYSHGPSLSALEVYGMPFSEGLRSAFGDYGFTTFQATGYGFCAVKESA